MTAVAEEVRIDVDLTTEPKCLGRVVYRLKPNAGPKWCEHPARWLMVRTSCTCPHTPMCGEHRDEYAESIAEGSMACAHCAGRLAAEWWPL